MIKSEKYFLKILKKQNETFMLKTKIMFLISYRMDLEKEIEIDDDEKNYETHIKNIYRILKELNNQEIDRFFNRKSMYDLGQD